MSKSGKVPPKAAKVLGLGNVAPKAAKVLGMGMAGGAKKVTTAVSKGKAPTPPKAGFKAAPITSKKELKPSSPIIGARGTGVTGNVIEKGRMTDRVKKAGLGGL